MKRPEQTIRHAEGRGTRWAKRHARRLMRRLAKRLLDDAPTRLARMGYAD